MPHEDRKWFALVEKNGHLAFEVDPFLAVALDIHWIALRFNEDMRINQFESELLVRLLVKGRETLIEEDRGVG